MIRVLILGIGLKLCACAQSSLNVPFSFDVRGKPFRGVVSVKILVQNQLVAQGSGGNGSIALRWQPIQGVLYDLDLTAGRHRVRIKEVNANNFRSTWAISLDFPPFRSPCGRALPESDRSRVIRIDCVVFDDLKGDPPVRVITHFRKKKPQRSLAAQ
jgi:hypothetical protein